jgi:hypothetical protein
MGALLLVGVGRRWMGSFVPALALQRLVVRALALQVKL